MVVAAAVYFAVVIHVVVNVLIGVYDCPTHIPACIHALYSYTTETRRETLICGVHCLLIFPSSCVNEQRLDKRSYTEQPTQSQETQTCADPSAY